MNTTIIRTSIRKYLFACATFAAMPWHAQGAVVTQPAGLQPGEAYRLAFVTSTTIDATSTDIATYNSFVQSVANSISDLAGLGATWTAIASTGAVNAVDNINWQSSVDQIYGLDGTLVSSPSALLFYDSNDAFFAEAIPTYEDGSPISPSQIVWTGTSRVGTNTVNGCCTDPLGSALAFTGLTGTANVHGAFVNNQDTNTSNHYVYAISSTLTAPTPEPGTATLVLLSATLCFAMRRRRAVSKSVCAFADGDISDSPSTYPLILPPTRNVIYLE
jgi:hypothetical protein